MSENLLRPDILNDETTADDEQSTTPSSQEDKEKKAKESKQKRPKRKGSAPTKSPKNQVKKAVKKVAKALGRSRVLPPLRKRFPALEQILPKSKSPPTTLNSNSLVDALVASVEQSAYLINLHRENRKNFQNEAN